MAFVCPLCVCKCECVCSVVYFCLPACVCARACVKPPLTDNDSMDLYCLFNNVCGVRVAVCILRNDSLAVAELCVTETVPL